ncbi:MAG: hypothetical protein A2Z25_08375 [Planctomycetes bacterium RBG_16_55_9]|nr:MAG: hypothetical protein A2Z25_08375 [Planctomycetes bacterium RBG_16_55_9]
MFVVWESDPGRHTGFRDQRKKRPGMDLSEFEGEGIRITLVTEKRDVIAIVPPADSEARRNGQDMMFLVCSEACGTEMKAVMANEVSLGDALFGQIESMEQ